MEMRNQPLLGLIAVAVLSAILISVTATQKSYAESIVNAYNIHLGQDPPTKTVKLPQQVLVDVLEGKIIKWNDPQIQALNSGVNLPAAKIYFESWSKSGDFSIFW
jgi:ABC-type phosphate transport system substrate-binding protein